MEPAADIRSHCAAIERCNQRGGRMLSVVDLIEAGTMTREVAAYALAAIGSGASFMIGARPGGAGKTTVMGALLNFVPRDVGLAAADGEEAIAHGLRDPARRHCYICHEIGDGPYYAYLWGHPLRRYFELPAAGHMIATNLHADTFDQAWRQVCEENGVPAAGFRRMNLLFFLSVTRQRHELVRRIAGVWESDGHTDHRQVYGGGPLPSADSRIVTRAALDAATGVIDRLLAENVRRIEDVRSRLVAQEKQGAANAGDFPALGPGNATFFSRPSCPAPNGRKPTRGPAP